MSSAASPDSPNDIEDVVDDVNERKVAAKAIEDADEHTPVDSKPENIASDPTANVDRLASIEATLNVLGQTVKVLSDTVGSVIKDASPRGDRNPWTHPGGK